MAYAEEDRVMLHSLEPLGVSATVNGSEDYSVQLAWRDGALHGSCDCPLGQQQEFCKHQVAVALTWSRQLAGDHTPASGRRKARPTADNPLQAVQRWLAAQSPQALQALVLELAEHDRGLRQRLLSQAQLSSAPPQEWRKAVSALLGRRRFMDYRDSVAYAKHLATLPALLEQARQRNPVAALDLHEYAFKRLVAIYEDCDDSAGHVGDRLRALAHSHPEFARSANVSNLPKRVFDLRMLDQWSLSPKLEVYLALLGNAGIAALEHATLQALHDDASPGRRLSAEALLEETARCGGSVEAMLQWFARQCSSGWDYLEMARRCREHGREREQTNWLERGIRACPDDDRLKATLAATYTRDGMTEEALQLCWEVFTRTLSEKAYLALREAVHATHAAWQPWRERAMAAVTAKHSLKGYAQDLQVRLLLAEGSIALRCRRVPHIRQTSRCQLGAPVAGRRITRCPLRRPHS
ncbi:SWIM zinc finger domain-containing protein [Xanthomonas populi]